MGLFSRLTGKQPVKKATDDQLLFHAMLCMAAADGVLEDSEIATVEAFFVSLPEFRNLNFGQLLDNTNKLFQRNGGVSDSVKELAGIESPAVQKKAFILGVDVALASGDVDQPKTRCSMRCSASSTSTMFLPEKSSRFFRPSTLSSERNRSRAAHGNRDLG